MWRKIIPITMALTLVAWAAYLPVYAAGPSFNPAIYADGEVWSTKGLADLPPPNGHNDKSFDKLFIFINGAEGQLPVAEAAPGNRDYNGGRWSTRTAMWDESIENPPVLRSYDEIVMYQSSGDLHIGMGGAYFECPLLPVK